MYKIGDFSKMSKISIKALRYYEKEGLLQPSFIDKSTGYRYYNSDKLIDISKIITLKQLGVSIKDIKQVCNKQADIETILAKKKEEIALEIKKYNDSLSKISYLLNKNNVDEKIFEKVISSYHIYYREGKLKEYKDIFEFIKKTELECVSLNPEISNIEPDYCFINYIDSEYKETDIGVRYCQAVEKQDIPYHENASIKFKDIPEDICVCIYHKGSYDTLPSSYSILFRYIEENNYTIKDDIRECYIDGSWNKKNENEWLTEIQIPITK